MRAKDLGEASASRGGLPARDPAAPSSASSPDTVAARIAGALASFVGPKAALARVLGLVVALVVLGVMGRVLGAQPGPAAALIPATDAAAATLTRADLSAPPPTITPTGTAPIAAAVAPADAGAFGASASASAPATASEDAGAPLVDLNLADEAALRRLPGIGPRRARAIVELRQQLGGLRRVEDLMRIRGLGRAAVRRLRPLVTVGAPAPPAR